MQQHIHSCEIVNVRWETKDHFHESVPCHGVSFHRQIYRLLQRSFVMQVVLVRNII